MNKNQGEESNSMAKSSVLLRRASNGDLLLQKDNIEKEV